MSESIIGAALGRVLIGTKGLSSVVLPDALEKSVSASLVKRFNDLMPSQDGHPVAVRLLGTSGSVGNETAFEKDESELMQVRFGDRLVISDISSEVSVATIQSAFVRILRPDFPYGFYGSEDTDVERPFSLEDLAGAVLDELVAQGLSRYKLLQSDLDLIRLSLAEAMNYLGEVYANSSDASSQWNRTWFAHIDSGLELLLGAVNDRARVLNFQVYNYVFAALGLPQPSSGHGYQTANRPQRYNQIVDDHWSTEDQISDTLVRLSIQPSTGPSVEGLTWAGIDQNVFGLCQNPVYRFVSHSNRDSDYIERFAHLTEEQFFAEPPGEEIAIYEIDSSGNLISTQLAMNSTSSVIRFAQTGIGSVESTQLSVELPLVDVPSDIATRVATSSISLIWAGKKPAKSFKCFGRSFNPSNNTVSLIGSFEAVPSNGVFEWNKTAQTIKMEIDRGDALRGLVDHGLTAKGLAVPVGAGNLILQDVTGRKPKALELLPPHKLVCSPAGQLDLEDPDDSEQELLVKPNSELDVRSLGDTITVDSDGIPRVVASKSVIVTEAFDGDSLSSGSVTYVVIAENMSPKSVMSPVVAALKGVIASTDEPDDAILNSLRGRIEREYRSLICGNSEERAMIESSLGHIVLPSDDTSVEVDNLLLSTCGKLLVPSTFEERWAELDLISWAEEFDGHPKLAQFRESLSNLDLEKLLTVEPGASPVLPSQVRMSERGLSWVDQVDDYLRAYIELVEAARAHVQPDPSRQDALFWSSLPFTTSVWSTKDSPICEAVLLSPLHPIRLAWLCGVEHLLRSVSEDIRTRLGGLISGWNLPFFCPTNSRGKLMAMPSDNGKAELFLGWSLMARVSMEDMKRVSVPHRAGSSAVPGTSSSGVSKSGVSRAIDDFQRTFPAASTLTIDLAAGSTAPRLSDIDQAVIEHPGSKSGGRFTGGFRVFDSINRLGEIPNVEDLNDRGILGQSSKPFVWKRYSNDGGTGLLPTADIRILQDQGVSVLAFENEDREDNGGPGGVLGPAGLRRLTVRTDSNSSSSGSPKSVPGIGTESDSLLADAVRAVECSVSNKNLGIAVKIPPEFFGNKGTKWTVSGETLVRPGEIKQLSGRDDQILWEWQPPFLDISTDRQSQVFERRPYVSFSNLSQHLQEQIERKLKLIDSYPIKEPGQAAVEVVNALGNRGVGLLRAIANKDRQMIGALGFAFALELAGRNELKVDYGLGQGFWEFVFPLDMCDQYLRGIAGPDFEDSNQKADLLVLRIYEDGTLKIGPLEVKVRGLEEADSDFPARGNRVLEEAEKQAFTTARLLDHVADRYGSLDLSTAQGKADRYLIGTALASLVESCVALATTRIIKPQLLRLAISRLETGESELRVASPLVLYLGNGPTDGGNGFVKRFPLSSNDPTEVRDFGQVLVNAGLLAGELWPLPDTVPSSSIRHAWSEAVTWAFDGSNKPNPVIPSEPDSEASFECSQGQFVDDDSAQSGKDEAEDRELDDGTDGTGTQASEDVQPTSSSSDRASDADETDSSSRLVEGQNIVGDGVRFKVGDFTGVPRGTAAEFWPSNTALNQLNIGVVGDLGTGKTELIKSLVYGLRSGADSQGLPISFLILDYKGDYKGDDFLESVGGVVVGDQPIPLDLFDLGEPYTERAAWRRARQFVDIIKRIWRGIGPVQSERLEDSVTGLFRELGEQAPTLDEVSARYRELADGPDSVTNVLSVLTRGGWFSSDRGALKPFGELIGHNVLVVAMDDQDMDDQTKNTVAAIFLNLYRKHMFEQTKFPFEGSDPQLRRINSFILIDEAHNLMKHNFDALGEILLQGRQFGVGGILSSQYLSHFKTSENDYREPLLTWFIHKVPNLRTAELRELGIVDGEADRLVTEVQGLGVSHSLYKSLGSSGSIIEDQPFWKIFNELSGSHPVSGE